MISRSEAWECKNKLISEWALRDPIPGIFQKVGENAMYRYGFYIMALWHHNMLTERDVEDFCRTLDLLVKDDGYLSLPEGHTNPNFPQQHYMSTDDYTGTLLGLYFGAKIHPSRAKPRLEDMCDRYKDRLRIRRGTWIYPIFENMFERANGIQNETLDKEINISILFEKIPEFDYLKIWENELEKIPGFDPLEVWKNSLRGDVWDPPKIPHPPILLPHQILSYLYGDAIEYVYLRGITTANFDNRESELLFVIARIMIAQYEGPTVYSNKAYRYAHEHVDYDGQVLPRYYGEDPLGKLLRGIL